MIVQWNSERKARIHRTQSIGETLEKGVKKKQIKQKEETHWRGQIAGPKLLEIDAFILRRWKIIHMTILENMQGKENIEM